MKKIPLTHGMVALVDDDAYEGLVKQKWRYKMCGRTGYAVRGKRIKSKYVEISMHRVILDTPLGYGTDHINGDGLDNRKENLRVATSSQNRCNQRKRLDNTSGFKGVCWYKANNKWRVQIELNRRPIHIGYFKDKIEAAVAYNEAAKKYHGEFAFLNQMGN